MSNADKATALVDGLLTDEENRVLAAWALIIAASAVAAFLFTYDQIWLGAVILYYTFVLDVIKIYPEVQVRGRDAETVVVVGITLVTLYLHTLIVNQIEGVAVELGAAQVVALAALTSRGYVLLRNKGSFDAALNDLDPVTHPFITVGAVTTFVLGGIGPSGLTFLEVIDINVSDLTASTVFFLVVAVGATSGLATFLVEESEA